MRVALITTWETACGIAEHSAQLQQAVEQADPTITMVPIPDLHPHAILDGPLWDLVVLNYQAALLSQWTPETIRQVQVGRHTPVMVIYHDSGVPNSDQAKAICSAADAFVVHEPYDDLKGNGRYWRMGVLGWGGEWQYDRTLNSRMGRRPILGSIGFPFPWKNYDQLAAITAACGWGLVLIAPTATTEQCDEWRTRNPHTIVHAEFVPVGEAVARLAGCDATAFCYTCANTGQSGAVLQGIAARKPVFAFEPSVCRQFRALYEDPVANKYMRWCRSFDEFRERLSNTILGRVDAGIVRLAEQESWTGLGTKYAALFHELVA